MFRCRLQAGRLRRIFFWREIQSVQRVPGWNAELHQASPADGRSRSFHRQSAVVPQDDGPVSRVGSEVLLRLRLLSCKVHLHKRCSFSWMNRVICMWFRHEAWAILEIFHESSYQLNREGKMTFLPYESTVKDCCLFCYNEMNYVRIMCSSRTRRLVSVW